MTIDDIKKQLDRILEVADDDEAPHILEDSLHQDVLRAIADGTCEDSKACAALALTSTEIEFTRWYS